MYRNNPSIYQCNGTTTLGNRCKATAERGRTKCYQHGWHYKWYIALQKRAPWNGGPRNDWRSYRSFAVWPVLFDTKKQAEAFMATCFTFKGYGRKCSASLRHTKRKFAVPD